MVCVIVQCGNMITVHRSTETKMPWRHFNFIIREGMQKMADYSGHRERVEAEGYLMMMERRKHDA